MISAIGDFLAHGMGWLYGLTGNYGIAIILLTVAIKLVLHPLTRRQLRSMKAMQALAPQLTVLREKYKDDPKTMNAEVMNLYRSHGVNPLSGCLPMLVQLPLLYGLLAVLRRPNIFARAAFLGIPLDKTPTLSAIAQQPVLLVIPALVGITTYWQQHMSVTDPQQARMMMFMPILVAWFATQFPFALSIYWIVSTIASVFEYYVVVGLPRPIPVAAPPGGAKPAGVLSQRPKGTKKK